MKNDEVIMKEKLKQKDEKQSYIFKAILPSS